MEEIEVKKIKQKQCGINIYFTQINKDEGHAKEQLNCDAS